MARRLRSELDAIPSKAEDAFRSEVFAHANCLRCGRRLDNQALDAGRVNESSTSTNVPLHSDTATMQRKGWQQESRSVCGFRFSWGATEQPSWGIVRRTSFLESTAGLNNRGNRSLVLFGERHLSSIRAPGSSHSATRKASCSDRASDLELQRHSSSDAILPLSQGIAQRAYLPARPFGRHNMDMRCLGASDARVELATRVLSDRPTKLAKCYSLEHRPARRCRFWWDATEPRAADAIWRAAQSPFSPAPLASSGSCRKSYRVDASPPTKLLPPFQARNVFPSLPA